MTHLSKGLVRAFSDVLEKGWCLWVSLDSESYVPLGL